MVHYNLLFYYFWILRSKQNKKSHQFFSKKNYCFCLNSKLTYFKGSQISPNESRNREKQLICVWLLLDIFFVIIVIDSFASFIKHRSTRLGANHLWLLWNLSIIQQYPISYFFCCLIRMFFDNSFKIISRKQVFLKIGKITSTSKGFI